VAAINQAKFGDRHWCWLLLCLKQSQRDSDLLSKGFEIEGAIGSGAAIEPSQRSSKKREGASAIAAAEMMECCGDLNQRLQKALLGLLQGQPNCFPMFVGLEELPGAIAA